MNKNFMSLQVSLAVAAAMSGGVMAQDEKKGSFVLEEVVVTAQKRTESIQDIPISVQAFSANAIEKLGASTLSDLRVAAPSLVFGGLGSGSQQQMGMRGVVDFARNVGIDSRMGVYIDGVFQGRSYVSDVPLLGLESVEILRGPQGTLFGKNTETGAISLNTKKPSEEFEGQVGAEVGDNDLLKGTAYLSGPLTDSLFGSVSASYLESEGYYENLTLGKDVGDKDTGAVRGQLRFLPTDKLDLTLAGDYAKKHSDEPIAVNADLEPYRTYQNFVTKDDSETYGVALTGEYQFDRDYTLTSITAFRHGEFETLADDDYTPANIVKADFDEEADQWSQELRIASPIEEKYDWVAGAYFYTNDSQTERKLFAGEDFYNMIIGPPLDDFSEALSGYTTVPGKVTTDTYAAYMHGNYRFTEKLELTAGVRYTKEQKDVKWQQENVQNDPVVAAALEAATGAPLTQAPYGLIGAINYAPVKDDLDDDDWSPTIGLNYFATDDIMIYGKYSRGFKSGGWNADFMTAGLEYFAYDSESVDSYELGLKSTLFDEAVRLNVAAFYSEFDDYQVFQRVFNSGGNPSIQLTNAGEVTTKGLELESVWIPMERLQLTLNAVYLDTQYDTFINQDGSDYSDNELPFAPEWKTYVGAQYIQPLGNWGELTFNLDYSYTDNQWTDPANSAMDELDSYDLVNARMTYTPTDGSWEVAVWGKNLADEEYQVNSNLNFLRTPRFAWGEPQTYGVGFNYFFGG